MSRGILTAVALTALLPAAAVAQMATEETAATISPKTIYHHLSVIADDSMMGRDTPSPGLEMTAQYVADQFASYGLRPGGEDGGWFQRYPLVEKRIDTSSHVGFITDGAHRHARFGQTMNRWFGPFPSETIKGPAVLVGGKLDPAALAQLDLSGKVALLVLDMTQRLDREGLFALTGQGPAALVVLSNRSAEDFARGVERQSRPRYEVVSDDEDEGRGGFPTSVEVLDAGAAEALAGFEVDIAAVRQSETMVVRDLPELTVHVKLAQETVSEASAPNTIGILEGSDPQLKDEYVVFSAHMDHIGIRPGQPDSISNGADDDGSGTVGILQLAEAYSKAESRPRRSLLFITVSGEEKGLWGSAHFADHPTVPLESMVANINMDMIGRNWPDTIVAIGKEHSDLGETLNKVNEAHPELGMTAIDDIWPEERFYFRSDHFNFAQKGVPVLFFFNGVHDDYHQVSDELDKIDTEKMARIVKLMYYLGWEVANNPARPQWNPDSYREIVEGA